MCSVQTAKSWLSLANNIAWRVCGDAIKLRRARSPAMHQTKPPARSRRAFTLIEILVVIAIIALLLGILIPALGSARREARAVPCAANLRSIAQAMGAYLSDSRGLFPPAYVYGSQTTSTTWKLADQQGAHPNPINGYVHWSFSLLGDGQRVPEAAFLCPAAPRGGAPATNPGERATSWETDLQQRDDLGNTSPVAAPQDRQAPRTAYTANAAILPRNKLNPGSSPRHNRLVQDSAVTFPSKTILFSELVHTNSWRTVFDGQQSRSHRPITPFLGVSTGDDVYDQPDSANGGAFVYPARTTMLAKTAIGDDMLGYGRNPINAAGRSHPGGGGWIGGTSNFAFPDGHGERMSALDSLEKKLWGDKFYSLTGANITVRMTP
jgi:prepilin-type N-terminal cleavage/methylation domain-containing protein